MYKKVSKEIILILLMAAYLIVPASKSVVELSHAQPNQDMQAVLDIHNRVRAAVGFPPLTWSNSLEPRPRVGLIICRLWGSYAVPRDANLLLPTVLITRTLPMVSRIRPILGALHRPNIPRCGPTKR